MSTNLQRRLAAADDPEVAAMWRRSFAGEPARKVPQTKKGTEVEVDLTFMSLIWLPFLNAYRTMCLAPKPEFRRVLEEIHELRLVA